MNASSLYCRDADIAHCIHRLIAPVAGCNVTNKPAEVCQSIIKAVENHRDSDKTAITCSIVDRSPCAPHQGSVVVFLI
jgi:hypothetical protein